MTKLLAPFIEAWGQVRVHRARVLLSLLGVFLAVGTMVGATAVGRMGQQMISESFDSTGGRPATLQVAVWSMSNEGPTNEDLKKAYDGVIERHKIRHASTYLESSATVATGGQPAPVGAYTVDTSYGTIHRIKPVQGRWFEESDRDKLSPPIVVNEAMAQQLGITGDQPQGVTVIGKSPRLATVVGVVSTSDGQPAFYSLADLSGGDQMYGMPLMLEMWIPTANVAEVQEMIKAELGELGDNIMVEVNRQDSGNSSAAIDKTLSTSITVAGLLLLLLGVLGVVNVAIVTVRQRIREIGIRRSFGASSARVFGSVMLETALATAAAGTLAVAAAIAIVTRLPFDDWFGKGQALTDVPPFPFDVALQGVLVATALGLFAGLIPAIMAVRANPVEAIRF